MRTLARTRDKDEILARLRTLHSASERRFGLMSAHQMVCHLSDCFRMALGRKTVKPRSSLFERTLLKWFALYAPVPWPTGIPTRPEVDQQGGGGTAPVEFGADLAELLAFVEQVTSPGASFDPSHPIFGPMSNAAWMRWAYLHTDHHLRQFGA